MKRGRWTNAAAAQARVVARMRERGHSLDSLRQAVRDGRLSFGYAESLLPDAERGFTLAEVAERTGLEEELIERLMALLGTPTALEGTLTEQDAEAMELVAEILATGFPLVAMLQLIRVYAQSMRKIAEAEIRMFHIYVHEPLIRQGVGASRDGGGDGGAGLGPDAAHRPADRVSARPLPPLLLRAGRRRPHGDGVRRRAMTSAA